MPLRITAAALLQVTGIRLVASRPESLAHFLAFFASYQYVYNVTSFSSVEPNVLAVWFYPCSDIRLFSFSFCYRLIVRFEPADALSVGVMPHAIRI